MSPGLLTFLAIAGLLTLAAWWLLRRCDAAHRADWGGPWLNRLDGLNRLFCRHFHNLPETAIELPPSGPAIVVANHVSGLDPLLLVACCTRPLRFLIAKEQYDRYGLTWLFRCAGAIPVERSRRPEQALRSALRALQDDQVLCLFPFGKIHLDDDPPVRIKGGVAMLADRTGASVHPARIEGIKGLRHTVGAVFMRSDARVHPLAPATVQHGDTRALLDYLQDVLSRPAKPSGTDR